MRYAKKWKEDAVSPVIATILMVAITVVLAAVLYLMITVLIVPVPPKAEVSLGTQEPMPDNKYSIMVTATSHQYSLQTFTAKLFEDGVAVGTLDPIADNSSDGKIANFADRDGGETLTAGDLFVVQTEPKHEYELLVFYGNELAGKRKWKT